MASQDNLLAVPGRRRDMGSNAPEGFTEFVLARGPSLHRTAVLLTRNDASAQDLVQAALVKAWRSWTTIQTAHEAYVRRIIVNEFATGWRRRWRGEQPTADLPHAVSPDHGEGVAQHEMLMAALAQLPPRQRAIVVLRFFHDYTEARTAETLGISLGTVKSQTAKALASLRISNHFAEALVMPRSAAPHRGGLSS
jgi:RNA polymerase sigma-70 factor (sigma-E family)